MTRLLFKVAPLSKISKFIFDLRESLKEGALKDRAGKPCILIDIPLELKQNLISEKKLTPKLKKEISHVIKNFIGKDKKELKNFAKKIENYWNKNLAKLYFKEIEKTIGEKFDKTYFCYITNTVVSAYFGKNEITLNPNKRLNLSEGSYIIAEELLHLLYWKTWKKIFGKKIDKKIYEGKIWSAWHISEVMPEYLLLENPSFSKFNWNPKRERCYFWIPKLRKILDPLWCNKKDFDTFLIEAHKVCRCLP